MARLLRSAIVATVALAVASLLTPCRFIRRSLEQSDQRLGSPRRCRPARDEKRRLLPDRHGYYSAARSHIGTAQWKLRNVLSRSRLANNDDDTNASDVMHRGGASCRTIRDAYRGRGDRRPRWPSPRDHLSRHCPKSPSRHDQQHEGEAPRARPQVEMHRTG